MYVLLDKMNEGGNTSAHYLLSIDVCHVPISYLVQYHLLDIIKLMILQFIQIINVKDVIPT